MSSSALRGHALRTRPLRDAPTDADGPIPPATAPIAAGPALHVALDGDEQHVWELANPALVVTPETSCDEVERLFARRPETSSVVVAHPEGRIEILTRRRLTVELAGRLGHGRSLYGHRPVRALPGSDETLILDSSTTLTEAAVQVLARRPGHRYDDAIVIGERGWIATLSVARLFGELSHLHALRAAHDRLTGLPNRELFLQRLHGLSGPAAGLFIDLDDFKAINDSLGHSAGDELLIVLAQRLASVAGTGETVARLSGDEFGVLQPGGNEESAVRLALRIERALAEPVALDERTVSVGASIGIAISSGEDIALLLRNADIAMYEAKRVGKSGHTVYRDEMFRKASRRLELRTDVDHALAAGELHIVYEPIVALPTGATVGTEALLRWQHPRLGEVPPIEFVGLAESSGAIVEIGAWVLAEACARTREWGQRFGVELTIGVNVSGRELEDPDFPARVRATLERSGLAPERLTLEISETAAAAHGRAAGTIINALDELGVRLAIDDFGTGFSSLARLEQLPIDVLKIDKSFVARLGAGGDTRLLRGFSSLAAAMGIEAVIEGIETAEQRRSLSELGYLLGQGFHLSRPLEPDVLVARLASERPAPPDAA